MKTTLSLLLFVGFVCLNATAQTGKFYIELDAGNKPTVKPIGKSNVSNKYDTLQLCFPKSMENTKITFYDSPDKAMPVFKDSKIVDLADGTDEDTSIITILKVNGNYIIEGKTSPNIPEDFTIAFNNNHTSVFHLGKPSASAQTGKFYIELGAGNKPNVKPVGQSNISNKYETLQLCFPKSMENTKITFFNSFDKATPVFKDNKIVDLANGTYKDTSIITISKTNGNYTIADKTSPNLPQNFTIAFDNNHTSVFHLGKPSVNPAYRPGYLLYDAIYISEHWKAQKGDTINLILKSYGIKDSNELKANNYLNSVLKGLHKLPKEVVVEAHGAGNLTISSMLSSVGNLDVTNFADGLAKFIVDRTKQELNIAFFNKFKEALSDPKYVDLKTVFPETYEVLMVIDNQIYNYDDYLQAMRSAFDRDLSDLPTNLPSIIDNHGSYFDANPDLKVILQSSFYIAQQVQLKEHPGQMIENYPVDEFMGRSSASGKPTGINQNIASSFKTLQLISKSFKSKTDSDSLTHYWASDTLIKKLFNDDVAVKIYIGLLEQQAKNEAIVFEGKELWKIIDTSYALKRGYEEYKNHFRTVSSKIRDIENEIDALKAIDKDSLKIEKYHDIASKALDLMDHLVTVEKMPYFPENLKIKEKAGIYIYSARTASDIVIDVNRKQYASAIMKTVMLYDTIFHKEAVDSFSLNSFDQLHKTNLTQQIAHLQQKTSVKQPKKDRRKLQKAQRKLENSDDYKHFKEWNDSIQKDISMISKSLLQYGTFMATMIDAKTSDDVEAAIEAAALPVGSARIKRESTFNIALNAYCGPYMGYERVFDLDPKWMSAKKSTINSYGLTAPVGISISYGGNYKGVKNHSSYSLFLSVIDVGAIASFRFNDSTTEVLPTIQLKNILSPGIFFSYGIPTLPISVNAGWQMGPLLRKVDAEINENTYSERYGRVSISICVDIPIVNFYTFTSSNKPRFRL